MVQVLRYQYQQGESASFRPAGADRRPGSYRVWGLNPGDYYVSAVTRIDGRIEGAAGVATGRGGRAAGPNPAAGIANADAACSRGVAVLAAVQGTIRNS